MTCIVGLVNKGVVYMGGDGLAVYTHNLNVVPRLDEKVFINGPFIIGFTTSFYMGQLLRYKFSPPKQTVDVDDMKYMATDFIDSVKKCFIENDFGKISEDKTKEGGTFLVGYKDNLYTINDDYQVGKPYLGYDSCGCGSSFALGSMRNSKGTPESRIKQALETAAAFSGGVGPPYTIIKLSK